MGFKIDVYNLYIMNNNAIMLSFVIYEEYLTSFSFVFPSPRKELLGLQKS